MKSNPFEGEKKKYENYPTIFNSLGSMMRHGSVAGSLHNVYLHPRRQNIRSHY